MVLRGFWGLLENLKKDFQSILMVLSSRVLDGKVIINLQRIYIYV
jgi:hypothetical protein